MTINEDQHDRSTDDPLALMRIRHLIAVMVAAVLGATGVVLLLIGVSVETFYVWTGGLACLLGAVGVGVYAGQTDAASLTLRQQAQAAEQEVTTAEQLALLHQRLDVIENGVRDLMAAITRLTEDELRQQRRRRSG